jgi:lysophospholipase L1-like esterase
MGGTNQKTLRSGRILTLALIMLAGLMNPAGAAASDDAAGQLWISAWGRSPTDAYFFSPDLAGTTTRVSATPTTSGQSVRVVLTNRLSLAPIALTDIFIGAHQGGPALVPGTNKRLTFSGAGAVTIQPGQDVTSDPVEFRLEAFQPIAVSAAVSQSSTGKPTEHALQPSYRASGNLAESEGGTDFAAVLGSPLLAAIQVQANKHAGTVVTFGDSITRGYPGNLAGEQGYPEFLARRLAEAKGQQRLSVVNAGISGNALLSLRSLSIYGPSGLSRFDADVLAQAGVTNAIILIGINDIGGEGAEPPELIAGLTELVHRLRAAGVRPFLGTLTPSGGFASPGYTDADALEDRAALNAWIRGQSLATVIDFDRALADPSDPNRLLPGYDSGDHLHPNAAGYARMAGEIRLADLQRRACAHPRAGDGRRHGRRERGRRLTRR